MRPLVVAFTAALGLARLPAAAVSADAPAHPGRRIPGATWKAGLAATQRRCQSRAFLHRLRTVRARRALRSAFEACGLEGLPEASGTLPR